MVKLVAFCRTLKPLLPRQGITMERSLILGEQPGASGQLLPANQLLLCSTAEATAIYRRGGWAFSSFSRSSRSFLTLEARRRVICRMDRSTKIKHPCRKKFKKFEFLGKLAQSGKYQLKKWFFDSKFLLYKFFYTAKFFHLTTMI